MTDLNLEDRALIELKPCPFCGGPAREFAGLYGCIDTCAIARRTPESWNIRSIRTEGRESRASGEAIIRQIARLEHTSDEGWTPPDDGDDAQQALDGLITKARDHIADTGKMVGEAWKPDREALARKLAELRGHREPEHEIVLEDGISVPLWKTYLRDADAILALPPAKPVLDRVTDQCADAGPCPHSQWRPIDSALKDGKPVLAGHERAAFSAWWDEEAFGWVDGCTNGYDELVTYPVTHWMPLPAPPSDGGEAVHTGQLRDEPASSPHPSGAVREVAQALVDAILQDSRGLWFINAEDPEKLVTDLFHALSVPTRGEAALPDLTDAQVVHLNILRGGIAKPTPAQIGHLYRGDEAREVVAEVRRQNAEAFAPQDQSVSAPYEPPEEVVRFEPVAWDDAPLDVELWGVYGPECFPTVFACKMNDCTRVRALWGFSIHEGEPGYRTLGVGKDWAGLNDLKLFTSQAAAFYHLTHLFPPFADLVPGERGQ